MTVLVAAGRPAYPEPDEVTNRLGQDGAALEAIGHWHLQITKVDAECPPLVGVRLRLGCAWMTPGL